MNKESIERFLKINSGHVIGLGDIFDYKRSPILDETPEQYLERTRKWHRHIKEFIPGNHDHHFTQKHLKQEQLGPIVRKMGPVICFHGHQIYSGFFSKTERRWLKAWDCDRPVHSWIYNIEEWLFVKYAMRFMPNEKAKELLSKRVLKQLDKECMLSDDIKYVIFGHTHLPFKCKVFYKGKEYIVANCGSGLKNNYFAPVYVPELNDWFVSDLHLGTNKSYLE